MASINMNIFLIAYVVLGTVGMLARCVLLSWSDYPRKQEYTRGWDVFSLVTQIGFLVWAFSLIS